VVTHHDIALVDSGGTLVAKRRISESVDGLAGLTAMPRVHRGPCLSAAACAAPPTVRPQRRPAVPAASSAACSAVTAASVATRAVSALV
jgi:hypothetical protein